MMTFEQLTNDKLAAALKKQEIFTPTAIQEKAIPQIMEGKNAVCASETGSGKTLAYILPLFLKVDKTQKKPQIFIVAPTHELASQIYRQTELLRKNLELVTGEVAPTSALIIGKTSLERQIIKLKEKPNIIIGSAGRILELISLKKLSAHCVKTIVLDEVDKLLNKNNLAETCATIKSALSDTQILAFSATADERTAEVLAKSAANRTFTLVLANEDAKLPKSIEHFFIFAENRDKVKVLRKLAHSSKGIKAIVFVNNPYQIKELTERLNFHNLAATTISGGELGLQRKNALAAFSDGRVSFLVASDVAARGLDVDGVTHIINFDAPQSAEDYLHRAGRTGRAGKAGAVVSIFTKYESRFLPNYKKALNIEILEIELQNGKILFVDGNNLEKINKNRANFV